MASPDEHFDKQTKLELEAAAFRQLMAHLDERKDVQNIDLMNLAGFCRNCLSKWYLAAAEERGQTLDYEQAREIVYGDNTKNKLVDNQELEEFYGKSRRAF